MSSRSGGLYFTREGLDPASGQRLDVTGKPLANGTILRIRLDERTPEYAPAPEGEINICLEPLSRFEALFYGGAPFSYRLENLSLSTDVDCEVDAAFRKRLLEEIPGLAAALESGEVVRAAHLLLDWAAPVIDWGKPSARVSQTINMGSAANIFSEVFLGDMGGTYCGGSAIFYRKLLEMFGLEAFTVDCGLELGGEQKLTHKTTFLVVEKSEGYAYYLLDPTTGGTFMDRDAAGGEYLDLAAVLVRYDPQSMLLDAPDLWDAAPCVVRDRFFYDPQGVSVKTVKNGLFCIEEFITPALAGGGHPLQSRLRACLEDPKANIMLLLLTGKIYSVSIPADKPYRNDFLDLLARHGATVPGR